MSERGREITVDGSHPLDVQIGDPATVRALTICRAMGQGIYALPERMASMCSLERLALHQVWGEAIALPDDVASLPRLRELLIEGPQWRALPELLTRLSGLRSLTVRDGALRRLPSTLERLGELTHLELSGPLDDPRTLANLQPLASLTTLVLRGVETIDLAQLPRLDGLERLVLDARAITGWSGLRAASKLTHLTLSDVPPTSAMAWPRLRALTVWTHATPRDDAAWCPSLAQTPVLEFLQVGPGVRVDLAPLRQLPRLHTLALDGDSTSFEPDVLETLARLRHLGVRDHGDPGPCLDLSGCPALESLDLTGTSVRGLGDYVTQAPSLTRVYVDLSDLDEDEEHALLERLARAGIAVNDYDQPDPWSFAALT